ncbi:hypothetical protein [Virgibacillus pantothenticus]|uniref:hypothetical protein n=1 Tax=Virgibacillus pantothenticus TaxID=1473 RepID=UPI0009871AFE|nr:hypothetical protein [Virgibacillus pantothenticus]
MKKIIKKVYSLPSYFKVLVILFLLLNLAALQGLNEKESLDKRIDIMLSLLVQVGDKLSIENGVLEATPQIIEKEGFGLGILQKPRNEKYLYFQDKSVELSFQGRTSEIAYDTGMTNLEFRKSLVEMVRSFSMSSFFVVTIQRFFSLLLTPFAILITTLVLSKFRIKIREILDPLFISVVMGAVVAVAAHTITNSYSQLGLFVILTGLIYTKAIRTKLDASMTSYYIGEGA